MTSPTMTSPTTSNRPGLDAGNDVTESDDVPRDVTTADSGRCPSDRSPGMIPGSAAREQRASPFSSPETRKRAAWRKTAFMRELGALGHEIRRAGDSIRGSMESLIGNCSTTTTNNNSARTPLEGGSGEEKRRIRIETAGDGSRSTGSARRKGLPAEAEVGDWNGWSDDVSTDRNFSSALIVTNLENGLFSAQVALETIPVGNIVIRIRNYRLEIVLDRREPPLHPDRRGGGGDGSHRIPGSRPPQVIGSIDVPIYVDTSTLHFRLDADRDVLLLEGVMKGCLDREHSASAGELRSLMASHNFRKKLRAKVNAQRTNGGGSVDDSAKVKQQHHHGAGNADSWVDRFRSRAYTH